MGELQRMTAPRVKVVEEGPLKERLAALQELEARTAAELRKAYTAVDEVLDLRQQARFRIFEEQIERRKLELLMRARQQNRPNQQQPGQQPPVRRPNQPPPGV
jgi:lysozyme family protein